MRRSLALIALALLALSGCGMLRRRMANRPPYARYARYARVTPAVAYEMIRDSPNVLLLDLRSPQAFNGETGHLFRARNLPLARLPYLLRTSIDFRDDTFLVYCDTQDCGEEGMEILVTSGFDDAILIDGGIDEWIRKGFRTVLPSDLAGRSAEREPDAFGPPAVTPAPPPPPR